MIYKYSGFLMSVVFSVCLTQSVFAKDTDLAEGKIIRPSTPLIWNLNDLYPDIKSWGEARKNVSDRIRKIGDCKGRLSDDIQTLSLCMDTITDTYKDLLRLYTYAFLSKDADLSDSGFRERSSVAQSMLAHFGEAVSFLNPELVAIGDIKINKYLKESLILKNHNFYILNTLRQSKHVLSPDEESIIAALQDTMNTAASAYEVLTNAEIPWPEITLSDGRKSRLDPSGYTSSRGSVVRKDRELVFNEFWSTFHDYRQTLAITLEGQVKNDVIMARVRGYESSLEQALSEDNIPVAVYESLVSTVCLLYTSPSPRDS